MRGKNIHLKEQNKLGPDTQDFSTSNVAANFIPDGVVKATDQRGSLA